MLRAVLLCFFLCLFIAGSSPAAAGTVPLDQAGFTAYVANITRKAYPDGSVTIAGPLQLTIKHGGETWGSYLATLYSYCTRNPDPCEDEITQHIEQLLAAHKAANEPIKAAALRIIVRPSAYVDQIAENLKGRGQPIAEPLVGDLWIIAVVDLPTAVSILKPSDLATLHLSADDALTRAKENTKADISKRVPAKIQKEKGIGVLPGDTYEASLLAFPEIWAPLAKTLGNRLVAAAPGAHMIIFAEDSASDTIPALENMAAASMQSQERPLSAAVYRWTDKGWVEAGH